MRRNDGSNVWVERAVKVFWSRTRVAKPNPGNALALTNGEDDEGKTLEEKVMSATSDDYEYHTEMELLFTTRSILFFLISSL